MSILQDCLMKFTNEELLSTLNDDIRHYVKKCSRNDISKYIEKNIYILLENMSFVNLIIKHLEVDLSIETLFQNGKLTTKSKNTLLRYLDISYDNIPSEKSKTVNRLLPKPFYELLDYQFLIKEKVLNYIEEKNNEGKLLNRLIIHMPTGTGKTKTSMHTIIEQYKRYHNKGIVVWLAHTEELLQQAMKTFNNCWLALGNKEINLYYNDVSKINDSNAIYFITYQKLISFYKGKSKEYKEFSKYLTLTICDEAHKCLAIETYYAINDVMLCFDKNHPKTLIGLTATPGRKYRDSLNDGENQELSMMFDKNIFSINTRELGIFKNYKNIFDEESFSYKDIFTKDDKIIQYFQDRKILARIERYPLSYSFSDADINHIFNKKRKTDYTKKELIEIGNNIIRNNAIISKLEVLANANPSIPTILFACSNEQGKLISDILTLKGIKNECVFGDTNPYERRRILQDFEEGKFDILINNSILTTGFDSPRIKCVFITKPTNSIVLYSQMLGRGLRGLKMGGNEECLLIDVVDNLNKFYDENFAFNYFSVYWRK